MRFVLPDAELEAPFSPGDPGELDELLRAAGFKRSDPPWPAAATYG
jgi:hypothetical protein